MTISVIILGLIKFIFVKGHQRIISLLLFNVHFLTALFLTL